MLLAMVPPVARSNIFFICVFTFHAASQQRDFFASLLVTKKEEPYSRMLLYTVVTAWGGQPSAAITNPTTNAFPQPTQHLIS